MTNRVTKGNGAGSSAFRRLTRADLVTFDREAKDLILEAMEVGCLGRVSAKGHAILRNNTGGTTSVPRNMTAPNRSAQNARADMRRLLAEHRPALEKPPSTRPPRRAQQMTVAQAFVEHGAAFSRWFDALPAGLRADQLLKVSFDEADAPSFEPVPTGVSTGKREPTTNRPPSQTPDPPRRDRPAAHPKTTPETGREAETDMSTEAQPASQEPDPISAAEPAAEAREEIVQRVRAVPGEDSRLAVVEAKVAALETALAQQTQRTEEVQTQLGLIEEAFQA